VSLQPTSAVAGLTLPNLRRVVEDIGDGPGWYTSARLYEWYAGMAREDGLEPLTKKAFGLALAELGFRPSTRRFEGKRARCWFISGRAWRS
jgi:hypothetical protein